MIAQQAQNEAAVFLIGIFGTLFVIFLIIKYAVRAGVQPDKHQAQHYRPQPARQAPISSQADAKPANAAIDGPGVYCVSGVDRETKMDTTWRVRAETAANARAKAELEGIIVTDVTWESK